MFLFLFPFSPTTKQTNYAASSKDSQHEHWMDGREEDDDGKGSNQLSQACCMHVCISGFCLLRQARASFFEMIGSG
jgi:hypothetical protein